MSGQFVCLWNVVCCISREDCKSQCGKAVQSNELRLCWLSMVVQQVLTLSGFPSVANRRLHKIVSSDLKRDKNLHTVAIRHEPSKCFAAAGCNLNFSYNGDGQNSAK